MRHEGRVDVGLNEHVGEAPVCSQTRLESHRKAVLACDADPVGISRLTWVTPVVGIELRHLEDACQGVDVQLNRNVVVAGIQGSE